VKYAVLEVGLCEGSVDLVNFADLDVLRNNSMLVERLLSLLPLRFIPLGSRTRLTYFDFSS
jgi:hypothetical protein